MSLFSTIQHLGRLLQTQSNNTTGKYIRSKNDIVMHYTFLMWSSSPQRCILETIQYGLLVFSVRFTIEILSRVSYDWNTFFFSVYYLKTTSTPQQCYLPGFSKDLSLSGVNCSSRIARNCLPAWNLRVKILTDIIKIFGNEQWNYDWAKDGILRWRTGASFRLNSNENRKHLIALSFFWRLW